MKTNSLNRIALAVICFFTSSLVFISCQKENSAVSAATDTVTEEQATTYSDESAQADASFDDTEDLAMIAADE